MNLDEIELTDEQQEQLVEMRGGCTCFLSPPCGNHVNPLTEEEAEELGLFDPEPVDYMKITETSASEEPRQSTEHDLHEP